MNELKPEDVYMALELHADCETDNCFECPYEKYLSKADGNCVHHLTMDALALLREKDAKIKKLELTLEGVMWSVDKWLDEADYDQDQVKRALTMREKTLRIVEEKDAEIERLRKAKYIYSTVDYCADDLAKAREEIERLKQENKDLHDNTDVIIEMVTIARAEAISEFAERLKEGMQDLARIDFGGVTVFAVGEAFIDRIAKKMKEGQGDA